MIETLIWLCKVLLLSVGVVLCGLLVWLVLSPVGAGVKWVLEMAGFKRLTAWLQAHLPRANPLAWWRQVFETTTAGFLADSNSKSVKLVVDERLGQLRRAMRSTVEATRKACQNLEGLGGVSGPAGVVAEVKELQRRTEDVAKLGGEIPEDLVKDYQGRARAMSTMVMLVLFALAFAAVNGTLLNLFFRDVLTIRLYGVPASLLVSIGFIVAEMALGFGIAYFFKAGMRPAGYLLVFVVGLAALFEAIIFGIVSYGFELDIPLLDDNPLLKLWMAPLGIIFVTATAVVGYIFHRTKDELDDVNGAARLRREINAVNRFVRGLPGRWDGIAGKARNAEGAIGSFVDALGNKAGALKGAIDAVRTEREAMTRALVEAKVDDWREWLEGSGGDVRLATGQNVLIAAGTVGVGYGFVRTLFRVFADSAIASWPTSVLLGLAIAFGLAFFLLGWYGFQRIQLVETDKARVYPLRSAPAETWVFGTLLMLVSVGVVAVVVQALGVRGVPQAAILLACGAILAVAGYNMDRVAMGAGYLARLVLGGLLSVLAFLAAVVVQVLGWPFWFLLHLIFVIVSIIAAPFEKLLEWWRKRGSGPPAQIIRGPRPVPAPEAVT
ncbi:MAG: hypothetical protein JWR84_1866 [Caulobacter sp.]|nr:hypothetical protein [Caulobacter sp.]